MEYRTLGLSGIKVPVLSFGTITVGGANHEFFKGFGASDVAEATRLVDVCLDAGVNAFDTADVYSAGAAEEVLGKAIGTRRANAIISTKASFRTGPGPNDVGNSRRHLVSACDASLRRLGTDYIDIFHLHGFDALTSLDETMSALDGLVQSGKVRYLGCSNFSGWHLMKALPVSDRAGLARMIAHQAFYSLVQTVSSVIVGARTEAQLLENLGAVGWRLTAEQVARLDAASAVPRPYPYWHQQGTAADRNPLPC